MLNTDWQTLTFTTHTLSLHSSNKTQVKTDKEEGRIKLALWGGEYENTQSKPAFAGCSNGTDWVGSFRLWWDDLMKSRRAKSSNRSRSVRTYQTPKYCTVLYNTETEFSYSGKLSLCCQMMLHCSINWARFNFFCEITFCYLLVHCASMTTLYHSVMNEELLLFVWILNYSLLVIWLTIYQ